MHLSGLAQLWWLLALIPIGLAFLTTLVDRPRRIRLASFVCRAAAVVLLAIGIARPTVQVGSERLHAAFLIDLSASVDLESARLQLDDIDRAVASLEPGDTWSLAALADGLRGFATTDDLRMVLDEWIDGNSDDAFRSATGIVSGLHSTRLSLPADAACRIVLLSDAATADAPGAVSAAIDAFESDATPVEVLFSRLNPLNEPEASLVSLNASPRYAHEGEVARITARVLANRDMTAEVRIIHRSVVANRRTVDLVAGEPLDVPFDVPMITPGRSVWSAEVAPEQDFFTSNNQRTTTIEVSGRPRVLVLHEEPRLMRDFERAMTRQDMVVETRPPSGTPQSMMELLSFDAVILADIPATDLSMRQLNLLRDYVADFGGGLAMIGSENSFGLGGYYRTPVEDVLPLVSRFEQEQEKPSLAMVLVIDKSGSMAGLPVSLARQAAKATVELLSARDQIGVIGFDSEAFIAAELQPAAGTSSVQSQIDRLEAGGGTNMYIGMLAGRDMLEGVAARLKHMIVLGDGMTPSADHFGLTTELVDMGVTVSTVALGDGADRNLLSSIAERGRGRYYETMDPSTVPQIFTRETMRASRSAIKEDLVAGVQVSDHPILDGFRNADLPFALGYVMTQARPTSRVLLATDTGDPLLAVSTYGLGSTLCFTSDLTPRWGGEWLAWAGFGRFWAQALRALARRPDSTLIRALQSTEGNDWLIDLSRPIEEAQSGVAQWEAELIDDAGRRQSVDVESLGVGRDRVRAPLGTSTDLTLRVHDPNSGLLRIFHRTQPYPAEFNLDVTPDDRLMALRRFEPETIRDDLPRASRRADLMPWFLLASLVTAMVGVLLRRI